MTGAGSGIGRATTLLFAEQGAKVFCTDWNADACEEAVAAARAVGAQADGMAADAGDEALAQAVVQRCVQRTRRRRVPRARLGEG